MNYFDPSSHWLIHFSHPRVCRLWRPLADGVWRQKRHVFKRRHHHHHHAPRLHVHSCHVTLNAQFCGLHGHLVRLQQLQEEAGGGACRRGDTPTHVYIGMQPRDSPPLHTRFTNSDGPHPTWPPHQTGSTQDASCVVFHAQIITPSLHRVRQCITHAKVTAHQNGSHVFLWLCS